MWVPINDAVLSKDLSGIADRARETASPAHWLCAGAVRVFQNKDGRYICDRDGCPDCDEAFDLLHAFYFYRWEESPKQNAALAPIQVQSETTRYFDPVIYIIQADHTAWYKIGWTCKPPNNRLATLQTGCPFRLRIRCTVKGTQEDELLVHKKLQHLRGNGEWFKLNEKEIRWLQSGFIGEPPSRRAIPKKSRGRRGALREHSAKISERTRLGLAKARAEGKRLGRPAEAGPSHEAVALLRSQGLSWAQVASRLDCTAAMARRRAGQLPTCTRGLSPSMIVNLATGIRLP